MRYSYRACDTLIFRCGLCEIVIGFLPTSVRKDDQICEYLIMLASWCEFINSREFGKPTNPPNMVSMRLLVRKALYFLRPFVSSPSAQKIQRAPFLCFSREAIKPCSSRRVRAPAVHICEQAWSEVS